MKFIRRQLSEPDHLRRLDDSRFGSGFPPPLCATTTMRGVDRCYRLGPGAEQLADDLAETVSAVAHWEQLEAVAGTGPAPAPGDGLGRGLSGQRAFEFV